MAGGDTQEEETPLDIPRHLRYWKRCLRSPLPHGYVSNEGNRLALAYFIVNSIAILTPSGKREEGQRQQQLEQLILPEERRALREWVLSHQHGGGGFCGTSSLTFPIRDYEEWSFETQTPEIEHSGLANIAATLFALQLLALLADEDDEDNDVFRGVDRVRTLRWLRRLQRDDGSFGEVLRELPGKGWAIQGGFDMRYCYIAASIRWFLRGDVKEGETGWVEDFDTEGLARYILNSQVSTSSSLEFLPHGNCSLNWPYYRHMTAGSLPAHEKSHTVSVLSNSYQHTTHLFLESPPCLTLQ